MASPDPPDDNTFKPDVRHDAPRNGLLHNDPRVGLLHNAPRDHVGLHNAPRVGLLHNAPRAGLLPIRLGAVLCAPVTSPAKRHFTSSEVNDSPARYAKAHDPNTYGGAVSHYTGYPAAHYPRTNDGMAFPGEPTAHRPCPYGGVDLPLGTNNVRHALAAPRVAPEYFTKHEVGYPPPAYYGGYGDMGTSPDASHSRHRPDAPRAAAADFPPPNVGYPQAYFPGAHRPHSYGDMGTPSYELRAHRPHPHGDIGPSPYALGADRDPAVAKAAQYVDRQDARRNNLQYPLPPAHYPGAHYPQPHATKGHYGYPGADRPCPHGNTGPSPFCPRANTKPAPTTAPQHAGPHVRQHNNRRYAQKIGTAPRDGAGAYPLPNQAHTHEAYGQARKHSPLELSNERVNAAVAATVGIRRTTQRKESPMNEVRQLRGDQLPTAMLRLAHLRDHFVPEVANAPRCGIPTKGCDEAFAPIRRQPQPAATTVINAARKQQLSGATRVINPPPFKQPPPPDVPAFNPAHKQPVATAATAFSPPFMQQPPAAAPQNRARGFYDDFDEHVTDFEYIHRKQPLPPAAPATSRRFKQPSAGPAPKKAGAFYDEFEERRTDYEQVRNISHSPLVHKSDIVKVGLIAHGGSGSVYRVRNKRTGDNFALKEMHLDATKGRSREEMEDSFQREEAAGVKVADSLWVVDVHQTMRDGDTAMLLMEYCPRGDLQSYLDKHLDKLTVNDKREISAMIVKQIEDIHRGGMTHHDFKPANMLINGRGRLKLADFDLAHADMAYIPKAAGEGGFTPAYAAPELLYGEAHNCMVDWWAFGCIVYQLFVGKTPFGGFGESDDGFGEPDDGFGEMRFGNFGEPFGDFRECVEYHEVFNEAFNEAPSAFNLIEGLLTKDPRRRLGARGAGEVKAHPWFAGVDWNALDNGVVEGLPDFD